MDYLNNYTWWPWTFPLNVTGALLLNSATTTTTNSNYYLFTGLYGPGTVEISILFKCYWTSKILVAYIYKDNIVNTHIPNSLRNKKILTMPFPKSLILPCLLRNSHYSKYYMYHYPFSYSYAAINFAYFWTLCKRNQCWVFVHAYLSLSMLSVCRRLKL